MSAQWKQIREEWERRQHERALVVVTWREGKVIATRGHMERCP